MNEYRDRLFAMLSAAQTAGNHIGWRELLAAAVAVARQIAGDIFSTIDRQIVIDSVVEAYRAFVKPVNLPFIPDFMEPQFDEAVERALVRELERILSIKVVTTTAGPYYGVPKE